MRRESDEFFKRFKVSAPAFDILRLIERLAREVAEIGEDGDNLRAVLTNLQYEIQQFRDAGNVTVEGEYWKRWSTALWKVRENPVAPDIAKFSELKIDESVFAKAVRDTGPSPLAMTKEQEFDVNATPGVAPAHDASDPVGKHGGTQLGLS